MICGVRLISGNGGLQINVQGSYRNELNLNTHHIPILDIDLGLSVNEWKQLWGSRTTEWMGGDCRKRGNYLSNFFFVLGEMSQVGVVILENI